MASPSADGTGSSSPSYKRRQALRDANTTTIQVLDSNPIERYYETSLKLLSAFQQAVDERRLDQAYVYGVRFASFSIDSLPQHKHYKLSKSSRLQSRNLKQVDMVLKMMEVVTQRMDAEEMLKEKQRQERLAEEEVERRNVQIQQEKERKQHEDSLRQKKDNEKHQIEKSAMAKLEALGKTLQKPSPHTQEPAQKEETPTSHVTTTQSTEKSSCKIVRDSKDSSSDERRPHSERNTTKKRPSTKNSSTPFAEKTTSVPSPDTVTNHVSSQPTTTSKIAKSSSEKEQPRQQPQLPKRVPKTKEETTIDLLRQAISTQENRLDQIEQVQIPALLQEAKNHLRLQKQNMSTKKEARQPQESLNVSKNESAVHDKHRKAALGCVARKKRLEQQMDVIKAAIFNMETQMFMLETALEDQHVQKAMKEASQVMKELQQTVGMSESELDLTDITASLQLPDGDLLEEEDLLEELEEWLLPTGATSSGKPSKTKLSPKSDDLLEDDISILSLPTVPDEEPSLKVMAPKSSSSVRKLLKAVLG